MPLLLVYGYLALIAGAILLVAYVVSAWFTRLSIDWANRHQLIATVNERSSHQLPTPRIGGVGLAGGVAIGLLILLTMWAAPDAMPLWLRPVSLASGGTLTLASWLTLTASLALAFALGLWDDRSNPPAVAKLAGQLLIAAIPPLGGWRLLNIDLPGGLPVVELSPVFSGALTALWIFFVMNAVNFMDGINGLAGRFAQIVALAALLGVAPLSGWESILVLSVALYGAAEGFLKYNHPKASTFMGDCGSQPLGVLVALLGIEIGRIPNTVAELGFVLVVSVFLFDVLFTLLRRSLRGENVLKAHREHLYQRFLVAQGEDHLRTLAFVESYLIFTAVCGVIYIRMPYYSWRATAEWVLIALTVLALALYWWRTVSAERAAGTRRSQ